MPEELEVGMSYFVAPTADQAALVVTNNLQQAKLSPSLLVDCDDDDDDDDYDDEEQEEGTTVQKLECRLTPRIANIQPILVQVEHIIRGKSKSNCVERPQFGATFVSCKKSKSSTNPKEVYAQIYPPCRKQEISDEVDASKMNNLEQSQIICNSPVYQQPLQIPKAIGDFEIDEEDNDPRLLSGSDKQHNYRPVSQPQPIDGNFDDNAPRLPCQWPTDMIECTKMPYYEDGDEYEVTCCGWKKVRKPQTTGRSTIEQFSSRSAFNTINPDDDRSLGETTTMVQDTAHSDSDNGWLPETPSRIRPYAECYCIQHDDPNIRHQQFSAMPVDELNGTDAEDMCYCHRSKVEVVLPTYEPEETFPDQQIEDSVWVESITPTGMIEVAVERQDPIEEVPMQYMTQGTSMQFNKKTSPLHVLQEEEIESDSLTVGRIRKEVFPTEITWGEQHISPPQSEEDLKLPPPTPPKRSTNTSPAMSIDESKPWENEKFSPFNVYSQEALSTALAEKVMKRVETQSPMYSVSATPANSKTSFRSRNISPLPTRTASTPSETGSIPIPTPPPTPPIPREGSSRGELEAVVDQDQHESDMYLLRIKSASPNIIVPVSKIMLELAKQDKSQSGYQELEGPSLIPTFEIIPPSTEMKVPEDNLVERIDVQTCIDREMIDCGRSASTPASEYATPSPTRDPDPEEEYVQACKSVSFSDKEVSTVMSTRQTKKPISPIGDGPCDNVPFKPYQRQPQDQESMAFVDAPGTSIPICRSIRDSERSPTGLLRKPVGYSEMSPYYEVPRVIPKRLTEVHQCIQSTVPPHRQQQVQGYSQDVPPCHRRKVSPCHQEVEKTLREVLRETSPCHPEIIARYTKIPISNPKVLPCQPEVRRCSPDVPICYPKVLGCHPEVRRCSPDVQICYPKVPSCHPVVRQCSPDVPICYPKVPSCHPDVRQCSPEVPRCPVEMLDDHSGVCNHKTSCRSEMTTGFSSLKTMPDGFNYETAAFSRKTVPEHAELCNNRTNVSCERSSKDLREVDFSKMKRISESSCRTNSPCSLHQENFGSITDSTSNPIPLTERFLRRFVEKPPPCEPLLRTTMEQQHRKEVFDEPEEEAEEEKLSLTTKLTKRMQPQVSPIQCEMVHIPQMKEISVRSKQEPRKISMVCQPIRLANQNKKIFLCESTDFNDSVQSLESMALTDMYQEDTASFGQNITTSQRQASQTDISKSNFSNRKTGSHGRQLSPTPTKAASVKSKPTSPRTEQKMSCNQATSCELIHAEPLRDSKQKQVPSVNVSNPVIISCNSPEMCSFTEVHKIPCNIILPKSHYQMTKCEVKLDENLLNCPEHVQKKPTAIRSPTCAEGPCQWNCRLSPTIKDVPGHVPEGDFPIKQQQQFQAYPCFTTNPTMCFQSSNESCNCNQLDNCCYPRHIPTPFHCNECLPKQKQMSQVHVSNNPRMGSCPKRDSPCTIRDQLRQEIPDEHGRESSCPSLPTLQTIASDNQHCHPYREQTPVQQEIPCELINYPLTPVVSCSPVRIHYEKNQSGPILQKSPNCGMKPHSQRTSPGLAQYQPNRQSKISPSHAMQTSAQTMSCGLNHRQEALQPHMQTVNQWNQMSPNESPITTRNNCGNYESREYNNCASDMYVYPDNDSNVNVAYNRMNHQQSRLQTPGERGMDQHHQPPQEHFQCDRRQTPVYNSLPEPPAMTSATDNMRTLYNNPYRSRGKWQYREPQISFQSRKVAGEMPENMNTQEEFMEPQHPGLLPPQVMRCNLPYQNLQTLPAIQRRTMHNEYPQLFQETAINLNEPEPEIQSYRRNPSQQLSSQPPSAGITSKIHEEVEASPQLLITYPPPYYHQKFQSSKVPSANEMTAVNYPHQSEETQPELKISCQPMTIKEHETMPAPRLMVSCQTPKQQPLQKTRLPHAEDQQYQSQPQIVISCQPGQRKEFPLQSPQQTVSNTPVYQQPLQHEKEGLVQMQPQLLVSCKQQQPQIAVRCMPTLDKCELQQQPSTTSPNQPLMERPEVEPQLQVTYESPSRSSGQESSPYREKTIHSRIQQQVKSRETQTTPEPIESKYTLESSYKFPKELMQQSNRNFTSVATETSDLSVPFEPYVRKHSQSLSLMEMGPCWRKNEPARSVWQKTNCARANRVPSSSYPPVLECRCIDRCVVLPCCDSSTTTITSRESENSHSYYQTNKKLPKERKMSSVIQTEGKNKEHVQLSDDQPIESRFPVSEPTEAAHADSAGFGENIYWVKKGNGNQQPHRQCSNAGKENPIAAMRPMMLPMVPPPQWPMVPQGNCCWYCLQPYQYGASDHSRSPVPLPTGMRVTYMPMMYPSNNIPPILSHNYQNLPNPYSQHVEYPSDYPMSESGESTATSQVSSSCRNSVNSCSQQGQWCQERSNKHFHANPDLGRHQEQVINCPNLYRVEPSDWNSTDERNNQMCPDAQNRCQHQHVGGKKRPSQQHHGHCKFPRMASVQQCEQAINWSNQNHHHESDFSDADSGCETPTPNDACFSPDGTDDCQGRCLIPPNIKPTDRRHPVHFCPPEKESSKYSWTEHVCRPCSPSHYHADQEEDGHNRESKPTHNDVQATSTRDIKDDTCNEPPIAICESRVASRSTCICSPTDQLETWQSDKMENQNEPQDPEDPLSEELPYTCSVSDFSEFASDGDEDDAKLQPEPQNLPKCRCSVEGGLDQHVSALPLEFSSTPSSPRHSSSPLQRVATSQSLPNDFEQDNGKNLSNPSWTNRRKNAHSRFLESYNPSTPVSGGTCSISDGLLSGFLQANTSVSEPLINGSQQMSDYNGLGVPGTSTKRRCIHRSLLYKDKQLTQGSTSPSREENQALPVQQSVLLQSPEPRCERFLENPLILNPKIKYACSVTAIQATPSSRGDPSSSSDLCKGSQSQYSRPLKMFPVAAQRYQLAASGPMRCPMVVHPPQTLSGQLVMSPNQKHCWFPTPTLPPGPLMCTCVLCPSPQAQMLVPETNDCSCPPNHRVVKKHAIHNCSQKSKIVSGQISPLGLDSDGHLVQSCTHSGRPIPFE